MRIHLIAIGGSAMHNMALALHHKGFKVTGSDDAIFEPSKGRLEKYGLLPNEMGWFPQKITTDLDAIILGMHAREDNPELNKAKELNIPIFSYPEYIYEQSKNKDIAKKLNIKFWTTIVIYKGENEIARVVGQTEKSKIYAAIKKGL